jgi:hypothetical protein
MLLVGQPILAAAGFQPVFFDRGRVSFRRDARSTHFPPAFIARSTVTPAVLPPVILLVSNAR